MPCEVLKQQFDMFKQGHMVASHGVGMTTLSERSIKMQRVPSQVGFLTSSGHNKNHFVLWEVVTRHTDLIKSFLRTVVIVWLSI